MISLVKTFKKFKNIESPKMVSKRLYGHILRSYKQFQKKLDFKGDLQAKSERKNRIYQGSKKLIKKWDITLKKFKKRGTPKMVLKWL